MVTKTGNRSDRNSLALWIALATAFLFVIAGLAGCGGGDEQEAARTQDRRATDLVPSSANVPDTASLDSTVSAGEEPAARTGSESGDFGEEAISQNTESEVPVPTEPPATGTRAENEPPASSPGGLGAARSAADDFGPYCVQVGSFRRSENAAERQQKVAGLGLETVVAQGVVDGVTYYRVYVPYLTDLAAANNVAERLERELGYDTLIRKQ